MFIHTKNTHTFNELKNAGFVPLKMESPYILLYNSEIKFNFTNSDIEINDIMYF